MCGIFGVFGSRASESGCRDLWSSFHHRGPDSHGTWSGHDVLLGHTRLAILDLSAQGHQPMESASGRFVISYNGEIYNFKKIAAELIDRHGARFRGGSDTEVILAALEAWGLEETLEQIDGIFAFAVWDTAERRLFLVRDRLGVKPLIFGWCGQSFLFASDTRLVSRIAGEPLKLSRAGISTYFRYGYVVAPYTMYSSIYKLPPGSYAIFDESHLSQENSFQSLEESRIIRRFWSPDQISINRTITPQDAESELARVVREAVRSQMVSDVPVGAFLSGGVDSSTVAAFMAESTTDRINTFSIGFKESRYNEAPYAKAVADYLGSEHHELLCGSDEALAAVQSLGVVYDEPFGDSSQIPTLLVSQLARRHVTVVLSGDGGDELFGGYPRYAWAKRLAVAQSMIPATARGILARAIELPGYRGWQRMLGLLPFIVPKSVPIEAAGLSAITVARLLKMNSSEEIYDFLCSQWPRLVDSKEMQWHPLKERLAAVFGRPGVSLTGRMTDWDRETYLPDDILTKVDRSSMWYGLEARVPLLDRSVVEFAYSLPDHIRFADHPTKKLLRGVLATKVPNTLIEREKQGFGAPVERWVRGALREWAEALLPRAEQLFAEFMPEVRIRELWRAYLDGRATWSPAIWSALMLAAWAEQWLDPHIFHGERSELREKYGLDPS